MTGFAAVLAALFAGLTLAWLVGSSVVARFLSEQRRRRALIERFTEEFFSSHMGVEIQPGELTVWRLQLVELPEGPSVEWMNDRLKRARQSWRVGTKWRWDREEGRFGF